MNSEVFRELIRKVEHDIAKRIIDMAYSYVPVLKVDDCIKSIKHDMALTFQEIFR